MADAAQGAAGGFDAVDHAHMARALELARRGLLTTTPNPRVGCVIAHGGRVVGEGFHEKAGGPHAEVAALRQAGAAARGATAYVTLEPCAHFGRTPPCADALVAAGVARVVAAVEDPNPQVSGRGLARLRAAGIDTASGLLAAQALDLNPGFVSRMTRARPWVRLKVAASLDGRTALANGVSQWITGEAARRDVHRWRARSCAVLTGIGTVLADDPQLTARGVDAPRQPLRVVLDRRARLPDTAKIIADAPLLVVTADGADASRLAARGAEVLALPAADMLSGALRHLAGRGCNEVMVEAGQTLSGAFLAAGLVDELIVYLAPMLLGSAARGMAVLPVFERMRERIDLALRDQRMLGGDLRLIYRVNVPPTPFV